MPSISHILCLTSPEFDSSSVYKIKRVFFYFDILIYLWYNINIRLIRDKGFIYE